MNDVGIKNSLHAKFCEWILLAGIIFARRVCFKALYLLSEKYIFILEIMEQFLHIGILQVSKDY